MPSPMGSMEEGGRRPDEGPFNITNLKESRLAYTRYENVQRARALREDDTEAEKRLWERLRSRRLGGLKFVRQLPVGPYFADFACRKRKLIVELDGVTHSRPEEASHDAVRTEVLERQGFRVMRFWNLEVFTNLDGVLESILMEAGTR